MVYIDIYCFLGSSSRERGYFLSFLQTSTQLCVYTISRQQLVSFSLGDPMILASLIPGTLMAAFISVLTDIIVPFDDQI